MATLTQINSAIKTILDSLTGVGLPLAECFAYPEPAPTQFPAAFIHFEGGDEQIADSCKNQTGWRFIVTVLMLDGENQASYDQSLTVTNDLLDEFRKDTHLTLGGLVLQMHITNNVTVTRDQAATSKVIVTRLECLIKSLQQTN